MDIVEAVQARKSIRGYKPDAILQKILKEVLEISLRAPSAVNSQTCEFTIVMGEPLEKIRQGNLIMLEKGTPISPDIPLEVYEGIYKKRQVDLAVELFKLMDIQREDKEKRYEWIQRGFRFFDAPAAIILSTGKKLENTWAFFDAGCIAQTICLVALKYGLGTCIVMQGISYTDVIREHTGIPKSKQILMGIAIGYPDDNFPANQLLTKREQLETLSSWVGI